MAAAVKPRPYRRILTSTLHRRFVHASAFSLLVCYVISFLIGVKSSRKLSPKRPGPLNSQSSASLIDCCVLVFWSWFPLGSCGIRTALLFISSLCVFVLRVGQLHIGARTAESKIQSWRQAFFSFDTIQTFGWYIFSSWWFSEVYRWSSSEDAELNWVKPGRSVETPSVEQTRSVKLIIFKLHIDIMNGHSLMSDQSTFTPSFSSLPSCSPSNTFILTGMSSASPLRNERHKRRIGELIWLNRLQYD